MSKFATEFWVAIAVGAAIDITSNGVAVFVRDDKFFIVPRGDMGSLMTASAYPTTAAYPEWLISPDETFHVVFCWSVAAGVATQEAWINGQGRLYANSSSNVVLPESGFNSLQDGFGITPAQGTTLGGSLSIYRQWLHTLTLAGEPPAQFLAAESVKAAAIAARG